MQELGGARCDALAKHLEVNRAEKAALAGRCHELAADVAALRDDVATAERRCESAEASVDAIAKASMHPLIFFDFVAFRSLPNPSNTIPFVPNHL